MTENSNDITINKYFYWFLLFMIFLNSALAWTLQYNWQAHLVNDKCYAHGNYGVFRGRNIICEDGTVYHVTIEKIRNGY